MLKACTLGAASLLAALLGGPMSAQPPTVSVNDYLKEVRVFTSTSPEFSQAASNLGVSASLASLGAGQSLVVAIRNDSGQAVELRILFEVTKRGKTTPYDLEMGVSLAAGKMTLVAPREIQGPLAALLNAGKPGLIAGGGPQPLDVYQGAQVTVSIDSVTLASGQFIGLDTQNVFDELVAEQKAKKAFFRDLTGWLSAGQTQTQIEQALAQRKAAADAAKTFTNEAAFTESGLCQDALGTIHYKGMSSLASWAAREKAVLAAEPGIHK